MFFLFLSVIALALLIFVRAGNGDEKSVKAQFDHVKKILQNETEAQKEKTAQAVYSKYYYYDKSRFSRYVKFKKKHPGIKTGDIVWMVNVNLDKPAYKDFELSSNRNNADVLVSKRYTVGKSYTPNDLVAVADGVSVRKCASEPFKKMMQAASQEGYYIEAHSGYRSYMQQNTIFVSYLKSDGKKAEEYSARPGFSEHQTGLAIDLVIQGSDDLREFIGTPESEWIKKNAWEYGFIQRYTKENSAVTGYTDEPWHIRYIGKKHSYQMKKLGITSYEEYKVKYIDYRNSQSSRKTLDDKYIARQRE